MTDQLPLTLTVTASAKLAGFHRSTIAGACHRGEIAYMPVIRPDGTRSRVHKKVIKSSLLAWIEKNTVRCPADLKKAVDGRRK